MTLASLSEDDAFKHARTAASRNIVGLIDQLSRYHALQFQLATAEMQAKPNTSAAINERAKAIQAELGIQLTNIAKPYKESGLKGKPLEQELSALAELAHGIGRQAAIYISQAIMRAGLEKQLSSLGPAAARRKVEIEQEAIRLKEVARENIEALQETIGSLQLDEEALAAATRQIVLDCDSAVEQMLR